MAELRPCPFCGAAAQFKELSGRWAVECTRKCAATRIVADKKNAAEIWNRRARNVEDQKDQNRQVQNRGVLD